MLQAGQAAPSVADILHLEKRWDKLPGASAGAVALEDAKSLLGSEVLAVSGSKSMVLCPSPQLAHHLSSIRSALHSQLQAHSGPLPRHPLFGALAALLHDWKPLGCNASRIRSSAHSTLCPPITNPAALPQGDPLEFVVQQVLAAQGLPSAPQLLTKRQFVSLAHVAEVAQSKAFDLLTAEEAAAPRTEPQGTSHKKRPPPIRDAHIDAWRIAAAPAGGAAGVPDGGSIDENPTDEAGQLEAAGPGGLSRATSLVPGGGPLAAVPAEGLETCGDGGVAIPQEQAGAAPALPLDAEVEAFTTKLNVRRGSMACIWHWRSEPYTHCLSA